MNTLSFRIYLLLIAALISLTFIGCSEDDDPAPAEEHEEAFGCMLISGTDTLVEISGLDVNGSLSIAEGDTSSNIDVWFQAEDLSWFQVEEDELDHALAVPFGDSDFADVQLGADNSEIGSRWSFRLIGLQEGATTMGITILHEGHEDYVSPQFDIVVTAP